MSAQAPDQPHATTRRTGPRLAALLLRETELYARSSVLAHSLVGHKPPSEQMRISAEFHLVQLQIQQAAREIDSALALHHD